jgi:hypothetical protein
LAGRRLRDVAASVEYYEDLLEGPMAELEGTVLVVRGATTAEVAEVLGAIPPDEVPEELPEDDRDAFDPTWAAYVFVQLADGVLAYEDAGYADPSVGALAAMSQGGRAAAVVRNNTQGHLRFGCARDGQLLFDDDEYMYAEDRSGVPEEIRPLFDLAWVDLAEEGSFSADGAAVALAMAEVITGVRLTREDLNRLQEANGTVLAVRWMAYVDGS